MYAEYMLNERFLLLNKMLNNKKLKKKEIAEEEEIESITEVKETKKRKKRSKSSNIDKEQKTSKSVSLKKEIKEESENDSVLVIKKKTKGKAKKQTKAKPSPKFVICELCDDYLPEESLPEHMIDCEESQLSQEQQVPKEKKIKVSKKTNTKAKAKAESVQEPKLVKINSKTESEKLLKQRIDTLQQFFNDHSTNMLNSKQVSQGFTNEAYFYEYEKYFSPKIQLFVNEKQEITQNFILRHIANCQMMGTSSFLCLSIVCLRPFESRCRVNYLDIFSSFIHRVNIGNFNQLSPYILNQYGEIKFKKNIKNLTDLEENLNSLADAEYSIHFKPNAIQNADNNLSLPPQDDYDIDLNAEFNKFSAILVHNPDLFRMMLDTRNTYTLEQNIPSSNKGLSQKIISSMKFELKEDLKQNASCIFCTEDMKKSDQTITVPCFHMFHFDCGSRWFNENKCCPVCKLNIDSLAS